MNNGLYGHRVDCRCFLCQYTHAGMQQASLEQIAQLQALQMGQQRLSPFQQWPYSQLGAQGIPEPDPQTYQRSEPTPGDVEHMKRAEPVDDEPVKQIKWKELPESLSNAVKMMQWVQDAMVKICGVLKK